MTARLGWVAWRGPLLKPWRVKRAWRIKSGHPARHFGSTTPDPFVLLAKHRSGPTGIVNLRWKEESMRFEDHDGGIDTSVARNF